MIPAPVQEAAVVASHTSAAVIYWAKSAFNKATTQLKKYYFGVVLNLLSLTDSLFLQIIFLSPEKSRKNTRLHLAYLDSVAAVGVWFIAYQPRAKLAGTPGYQTSF